MPRARFAVVIGACAAVVAALAPGHTIVASAASAPWFGVLQTKGAHATEERAAGVTVGTLDLNWSSYQPAAGQVNSSYVSSMRQRLNSLRSAGLNVVLDVGMQYPPAWIFNVSSNTRFVNQYGDVWHGNLSEDVPNAVFDSTVRNYEAQYIAQVAVDFGDVFYAVRSGGLLQDELRYPPAGYNGHTNSYWAFDGAAQAQSPVPGWKPGQAGTSQASSFANWYMQSITDFMSWLVGTYRSHFASPWIEVLMPSWGIRPGELDAAVARNLDGSTPPAGWGTLAEGLDWTRQVNAISDAHAMLYGTWMERGDDGQTAGSMAPSHYLATLGAQRGFPVAGENASSGDDVTTMQAVVQHARDWGLAGLMWLDEGSLYANPANLATYAVFINAGGTSAPVPAGPGNAVTSLPGSPVGGGGGGGSAYWLVASDGGIFSYGGAGFFGSTGAMRLNAPIIGMSATANRGGYWLLASDGGIFSFGNAAFRGSTGNLRLNQPVVGMAATPSGNGYWLVARDGGIFSFGDAAFYGSTGNMRLNQPVVGMAPTPGGHGYWLVASDGGIFSFGDAAFYGSTGAMHLNRPIIAMQPTPSGRGYWMVASDGGIFSFGDAAFYGSTGNMGLDSPVVGMSASLTGHGYRLVSARGGVYCFGDAAFAGSAATMPLARPVVGLAA
ncbi:MAG TPA: hypothetical protein VGQ42_08915 [Candidatus Dormibacteraeota bacterium]|jgi:hypothetical protein|nr:hypothetical protein [Candidatus Dormibacteraeota bacterium]